MILRIFAQGIEDVVFRFAIAGVGVFAENGENEPVVDESSAISRDVMSNEPAPSSAYHVKANVSQYVILQDTKSVRSGNQMPLVASSSVLALDARSMGTSSTMHAGSHSAKKMGVV